ncbi:MAG: NAD(P)H-binding protein [Steroidobacteraceae bacterium]
MPVESQVGQRVALVAGGTGITGAALLQLLLRNNDYARVFALTRRPLPLDHPRLANRILAFDELGSRLAGLRCHDAYCCIGAAQGPRAPLAELRRVDRDLALAFARAARAAGATRLIVVSAAQANSKSARPFLACKGEMEVALRELGFTSLAILQPGPVLGLRAQASPMDLVRMVLLPMLNPLLQGDMAASRAIAAADLAAAMLGAGRSQRLGIHCHAGHNLRELAVAGRRPG